MGWACLSCGHTEKRAKPPRWCVCGCEWSFVTDDEPAAGRELRARRATDAIGEVGRTVATGCDELDELLGGGIVEGSTVLVHGARGSGKTRLVTRWASLTGSCLFVHGELAPGIAAAILQSTGANTRGVWLYPELTAWEREAKRLRVSTAVIDSLSLGRSESAELERARAWVKDSNRIAWCINHQNARGKAHGGTKAPHLCDYEIRIEPCAPGSGVSRVRLQKSRLGPSGAVLVPLVPASAEPAKRPRRSRGKRA